MQRLTSQGQGIVDDLARRHGFSADATTHMLFAVLSGNGEMAQFNHPEFSGGGQWMRGGMLMLSDMFNHELKARVDALCHDVSDQLASQPGLLYGGSFQHQSQSSGTYQDPSSGASQGASSWFASSPDASWWPAELGSPSATGEQNDTRYAYFADAQRLAVQSEGSVQVYDTRDHRIGGFSQQQGPGGAMTFTSQYGAVDLASLPLVSREGRSSSVSAAPSATSSIEPDSQTPSVSPQEASSAEPEADIFRAIERLGDLKAKGILTDEEFTAKKAELLARL